MFLARSLLVFLLLGSYAFAQTNPGFIDGKPLCANYPNANCPAPANPLSLNQAFINKMDTAIGMVGDGSTNNTSAFNTLLTTVGAAGGSVALPCGTFVITGATTLTVAAGKNVTVQGQGLCTVLAFQGTNATAVTLGNVFSSIHWGHMRITTNGAGIFTGLTALMNANPVPLYSVHHVFEDIQLTGDDYSNGSPVHYWSTGLQINGLSIVNIDNVTSVGIPSRVGTGISVIGNISGMGYSTVINIKNYATIYNNVGLQWGSYVQGISVVASNFQSGNIGINGPAGTGLSELVVTNSQFGDNTTAGIEIGTNVGELGISNSLFEMGAGQAGIVGTGYDFKIVGNSFLAQNAGSGIGVGIALTSANGFGTISANSFTNLLSGINANAGSTYASVMITNNMHAGTTTPYNFSGGTNLLINDIQPIGVAQLPTSGGSSPATCTSTVQGSMMTVLDNGTAAGYRSAVTTGGTLWSRVFCAPTGAWAQN